MNANFILEEIGSKQHCHRITNIRCIRKPIIIEATKELARIPIATITIIITFRLITNYGNFQLSVSRHELLDLSIVFHAHSQNLKKRNHKDPTGLFTTITK